MTKKTYSTAKELKIRAAEIAGGQISNKESFHEAVKLAIQIEAMRKSLIWRSMTFAKKPHAVGR